MSDRIDAMGRLMKSVPGRVIRKFLEDQAPNWAALIAWNALLAIFPIVLFAASLLGFAIRLFGEANNAVYTTIFSVIPNESGQQTEVIKAVSGVKSQSGVLFIIGLVGLLWGGSALFGAMEQAFAVIYHTKPRDFIPQKLVAFGMVFLFTVLVGIAVATSSLLPALKHIPNIPPFLYSGAAAFILQVIVGITAGFLLFGSIYYVIPNRKQAFRRVIPGALVAGVMFELITLLFPLYLSINRGINQYGATFGLFFLLMTFFFFLGLITMIGVEVNSVIYPVPIDLPGKDAHAVAAPESGPEGERKPWGGGETGVGRDGASRDGAAGTGRGGIPARAALGLAVVASVVGVLLGRRSANSD
jgi:membrane protein